MCNVPEGTVTAEAAGSSPSRKSLTINSDLSRSRTSGFGPIPHVRIRSLPGPIPDCRRKTSENALARLRYRATDSILRAPTDSVSSTARQTGGTNQQRRTVTVLANQCFRRLDAQPLSSVIGLLEVGNGGVGGFGVVRGRLACRQSGHTTAVHPEWARKA
jgi:hypothetical protein